MSPPFRYSVIGFPLMQKFLRLCLLLSLPVSGLFAQRDIGEVSVTVDKNTIPVHVSANTTELNALALQAFRSHGRYSLSDHGYSYEIKFSLVGGTQVRVDVTRGSGGTPVVS